METRLVKTDEQGDEIRDLVPERRPELLTKEYVEEFREQVQLFKAYKIAILNITDDADWVDLNLKPYLQDSGIQKVAERVQLDFGEPEIEREDGTDKLGKYVIFKCKLRCTWRGRVRWDIGMASTRDDFFAKKKGARLDFEEIDILSIQKKAVTNAQHRLLTKMLGLGGLTWEQLQREAGIRPRTAIRYQGSERKQATGSGGWTPDKTRVWGLILDLVNGDKELASAKLLALTENKAKGYGGMSDPATLTDAQVKWLLPRVEKEHAAFDRPPADGQEEPGAAG